MAGIDPNASSNCTNGIDNPSPIDVSSSGVTTPSTQSTVVSMDTSAIPSELNLPLTLTPTAVPTVTAVSNSGDIIVKTESFSNMSTTTVGATTSTPTTTTRSPPLKRPRHKPGERKELLERAVRDVIEENISMRKAASRYNLAKSSLCDFVRKNHIVLPNNRCRPSAAAAAAANNSTTGDHQNHHGTALLPGIQQPLNHQTALQPGQAGGLFNLSTESMRNNQTSTPPVGGGVSNVLSKLESPWNNVSGLPTQVPMQNWSSFSLTSSLTHGKSLGGLAQISSTSSPKQQSNEISNSDLHSPINENINGGHAQLPAITTANNPVTSASFICTPLASEAALDQQGMNASTTPFFTSISTAASPQILNSTNLPSNVDAAANVSLPRSLGSIYAPLVSSQTSHLAMQTAFQPTAPATPSVPIVFPSPAGGTTADANVMMADSLQRLLLAAATAGRVDGRLPQTGTLPTNLGDLLLPPSPVSPMTNCFSVVPQQMKNKLLLPSILNSLNSTTTQGNSVTTTTSNCGNYVVGADAADNVIARMPHSQMVVNEFIRFINKSPTPFHVVRSVVEMLSAAGFRELSESDNWKLQPNDCVFVTKNNTSVFAVAVGGSYKPGEGFSIIGAHTDSPCLRLKPVSERIKEGFVELAVQTYGSGLWYTWFDRELTLAGRVFVRNPTTCALEERLIHINRPLATVPSVAVHLNRNVNKSFAPDPEVHLAPIISTTIMEQLNSAEDCEHLVGGHPAGLMRLIATELQCSPVDIVELELYLADTQPACVGGLHGEFIHAPRLDNQFGAYTSVNALVNSLPSLKDDSYVRVICLYDHEEIGSQSSQGAESVFTEHLLRRIAEALVTGSTNTEFVDSGANNGGPNAMDTSSGVSDRCIFERTMARSFFLSADQVHAVHPSWPEKHEPAHKPGFHQGLVLKHHVEQNYATSGLTSAIVKEIARRSNVPLQEYVTRQDSPSGRSIGPVVASKLGVMTADIGGAQLAMHSCREVTCTSSVSQAVALFTGFFEQLANILSTLVTVK